MREQQMELELKLKEDHENKKSYRAQGRQTLGTSEVCDGIQIPSLDEHFSQNIHNICNLARLVNSDLYQIGQALLDNFSILHRQLEKSIKNFPNKIF